MIKTALIEKAFCAPKIKTTNKFGQFYLEFSSPLANPKISFTEEGSETQEMEVNLDDEKNIKLIAKYLKQSLSIDIDLISTLGEYDEVIQGDVAYKSFTWDIVQTTS